MFNIPGERIQYIEKESLVISHLVLGEMPQRDTFHDLVKELLERDGWVITHDPYPLVFGHRDLYVDLGAERALAAEKEGKRIAVEVKSFRGPSEVTDLERALGQFVLYRELMSVTDPDRILFLAIPEDAFDSLFQDANGRTVIERVKLKIITFHPAKRRIATWIE